MGEGGSWGLRQKILPHKQGGGDGQLNMAFKDNSYI